MARIKSLVVGCGYLGRRVAKMLVDRGETVYGTTRSLGRGIELSRLGVEAMVCDVLVPDSLARLPEVDRVLYCVGFDRSKGVPISTVYVDGLSHFLEKLSHKTGCLVYVSSTGVYGQEDGSWVDEESPAVPTNDSGRACLEAERLVREFEAESGVAATVVRYSGLYGPGRIIRREALLAGTPIAADPDRFLNMIHVDDAARAAVGLLDESEQGGLYLASDDRPLTRREFYAITAQALGAPEPRFEPPAPGGDETNKRVSCKKLRRALRLKWRYPDVTTGLPAAVAETSASS